MSATRVGLTGGIGSGKSTVLQMLAELGAAVIDADAISRGATAAGGVGSSRVDLQACKLEYSIVSPK